MAKDNVLSLPLPGSKFIFTRYLYIKDEVKMALLIAILNKSDDAIFWAYELLYSGFKNELFALIWKIYYDFFASLNPSFASYLMKKQTENEDRFVSAIIQDLLIRSFNTDVFMMRKICQLFEVDYDILESEDKIYEKLDEWLNTADYRSMAYYILNDKKEILSGMEIYKYVLMSLKQTNPKRLIKEYLNATETCKHIVSPKIILLAHIMSLVSKEKNMIGRKNFYVIVKPEEVVQYETIETSEDIRPYKILRNGCICGINDNQFLNLFMLERRNTKNLSETYNTKWLFHASFSPIWFERIQMYKGYVNYEKQQVKFVSDYWEEEFHNRYNYEPDEQPLIVKMKTISDFDREASWNQFYEKYKKNGLIDVDEEELEELTSEPIIY
jgi:hypothetical protein